MKWLRNLFIRDDVKTFQAGRDYVDGAVTKNGSVNAKLLEDLWIECDSCFEGSNPFDKGIASRLRELDCPEAQ
jgi:hypothetical protein